MKTVIMKASFAGLVNWPAGSTQSLEDDEAARMVEHGFAKYVDEVGELDFGPVEARAKRAQRSPKRR